MGVPVQCGLYIICDTHSRLSKNSCLTSTQKHDNVAALEAISSVLAHYFSSPFLSHTTSVQCWTLYLGAGDVRVKIPSPVGDTGFRQMIDEGNQAQLR